MHPTISKFAAAVAQFAMLLINSEFKQSSSFENVLALAKGALADDREGYRKEFLKLVRVAQGLNDTSRK